MAVVNSYESNTNEIIMSVVLKENFAEISIYCPMCKENLKIQVDLSHRDEAKRFPFECVYIHGEPRHAITLYLDSQMQVRGSEILRNLNLDQNITEIDKELLQIPVKVGKLSPMARSLGMISQKEFDILKTIDGKISIFDISKRLELPAIDVQKSLKNLEEKKLIKF